MENKAPLGFTGRRYILETQGTRAISALFYITKYLDEVWPRSSKTRQEHMHGISGIDQKDTTYGFQEAKIE